MNNRVVILLVFVVFQAAASFGQIKSSQTKDTTARYSDAVKPGIIRKPARDFFMLQVGYNNWINKPDSVKTKKVGYVFNAFLCYDFPLKKSKFSFATGLGINTSVVYLDHQRLDNNDTGARGTAAHIVADTANTKRYKFNTTYLQAPFELRYYSNTANRNRGFKAAIGVQVGAFLGAHTKELTSAGGTTIKLKENTKRYISPWNFAATARVGMGNVSLFASYNITNVFKEASGPTLTPFSAGISISGL